MLPHMETISYIEILYTVLLHNMQDITSPTASQDERETLQQQPEVPANTATAGSTAFGFRAYLGSEPVSGHVLESGL